MLRLLARIADGVLARLGVMPTTQARMATTLSLVQATGIVYLGLAIKAELFGLHHTVVAGALTQPDTWVPSGEWLAFLVTMSGVDAAQFWAKRATDAGYVTAKQSGPSTPTPGPAVTVDPK
jgi:hypothetical protein